MGYSVRVAGARYTEWRKWSRCQADWSDPANVVARELYDHAADTGLSPATFDDFEFANLAYEADHQDQVKTLSAALFKQFGHSSGAC